MSHFELIESAVVSVATTQVEFTSIPQDYKHLRIMGHARSNRLGAYRTNQQVRINGASSLYSSQSIFYTGGAGYNSALYLGQTSLSQSIIPANSATANFFAAVLIDLYDYTDSYNKVIRTITSWRDSSTYDIVVEHGARHAQDAITSIQLTNGVTDNFSVGTEFHLFGVGI